MCCAGVPSVEFKYLVFTRMPGKYKIFIYWRFGSTLLNSCDVFRALINSFSLLIQYKKQNKKSPYVNQFRVSVTGGSVVIVVVVGRGEEVL